MSRLRSALRARLTAGRLLLAAVLVAAFLGLAWVLEGEERGAPTDHAVGLVPAGAVAYLHANLDGDSAQWDRARDLFRRFPGLAQVQQRFLRGLTSRGRALDLERDVDPWVGDEAAIALIPDAKGVARSLILLAVTDRALARSFLGRVAGRERRTTYAGATIRTYGALSTAFIGDFLAIGRPDNVRAAVDAPRRRIRSLRQGVVFRRARRRLPDEDRFLFAYASRTGLRRVLAQTPGLAGRLVALADDPRLLGIVGTLSIDGDDDVHLLFSSSVLRSRPDVIEPRLLDAVSGDAIAYYGTRGAARLLEQAGSIAGGRSLPFAPLLQGLRSELGRGGTRGLLRRIEPLVQGEAALFVSRPTAAPVVTLVVDQRGAPSDALLRLQPLLANLVQARGAGGQVATFEPVRVAGVDAVSLQIGPELELTLASFDRMLVVSTTPGGIRRVKVASSRLTDNPLFAPGLRDDLERPSSLLFLDLEQLLALGEQAGLGEEPDFQELKSDLSPIRAVTAITKSAATFRTSKIFIEVQ